MGKNEESKIELPQTEYAPVNDAQAIEALVSATTPSPVSSPVQTDFWDSSTCEALIGTLAGFTKAYSARCAEILDRRKAVLAEATTPVLNKYVKFGWAMEMNCAIAWSVVALEIVKAIQDEKKEKKLSQIKNEN